MKPKLTRPALKATLSRIITPVIIKVKPGKLVDLREELRPYVMDIVRGGILDRILGEHDFPMFLPVKTMPRFNMLSAVLPREVVFALAEDNRVEYIFLDDVKYALQYPNVPAEGVYETVHRRLRKKIAFTSTYWTKKLVGADVANRKGFTGSGVRVAVLDTGCSTVHEQAPVRLKTFSVYVAQRLDTNGHGTWCCACVAGRRTVDEVLSREVGKEVVCEGMAPLAEVVSVKCLGYVIGTGSDSDIIKGLEIALENNANIVSMSLGGAVRTPEQYEDPYYYVMRDLVENGVIPVVAAGNEGPEPGTIATPGWLESVLTVGAYDPITGEVATYSSRGPTPDGRIKPDVVAPGGGVPDHGIDNAIVNLLDMSGDGLPNRYSPIQGTSMATPHVAGLLACMYQAHTRLLGKPLTLDEVKRMMMRLGHPKNNDVGWGAISWHIYETWLETEYGVRV